MAIRTSLSGEKFVVSRPKKTRQGNGSHSKKAATSRNGKTKRYRGQGK